ncbi:unnamed protein product [Brassicogethes aeneus]|uniref:Fanconi-associated nuclease n=1 Tax=Brassicogethes aeneus TaxID=1431903 RepID=A0A9P0FQH0_BRAAE|nr:unnamed protein product [Brassicogethes aeneus]
MSSRKKGKSAKVSNDSLKQTSIMAAIMNMSVKKEGFKPSVKKEQFKPKLTDEPIEISSDEEPQVPLEKSSLVIEPLINSESDEEFLELLKENKKRVLNKRKCNSKIVSSTPVKQIATEIKPELSLINGCSSIDSSNDSDITLIYNPTTPDQTVKKVNKNLMDTSAFKKVKSIPQPDSITKKPINLLPLNLFVDVLTSVRNARQHKPLVKEDYGIIDTFLDLSQDYKFVIFKIFVRKDKWHNIFDFVKAINLDLDKEGIQLMYETLVRKGILDTDITQDDLYLLLNNLKREQVQTLYAKYKLGPSATNKDKMIDNLILSTKKQGCLTFAKSPEAILKENIKKMMVYYVKLKSNVSEAFDNFHLLNTFVNKEFYNISDFFFTAPNLVFPEAKLDECVVFATRKDFLKYSEARKFAHEMTECKDLNMLYETAETVYTQLQMIQENMEVKVEVPNSNPYIQRFTAKHVYIGVLSYCVKRLITNYPNEVLTWLTFLVENFGENPRVGNWYLNLSWINTQYLKPPNKDRGAELLIEALSNKSKFYSEIVLHELAQKARKLISAKKDRLSERLFVELNVVLPTDFVKFPTTPPIIATCLKSNKSGKKRDYFMNNLDGSRNFMGVEDVARRHYIDNEYYEDGAHCEGYLFQATYCLFFWDLIYEHHVPGTFISKYQTVPLDFYSIKFYENRRDVIDERLKQIESAWTDEEALDFLLKSWEKNSHRHSFCSLARIVEDPDILSTILLCVPRGVLAKIYARFAQSFGEFKSGMPDLLMWDTAGKRHKMVEVKGYGDKLQTNQKVWIQHLLTFGANVEVCLVNSQAKKK